jgi:hypothetical protein
MGINKFLINFKKRITIIASRIMGSNNKDHSKNNKNIKPPSWGSPI